MMSYHREVAGPKYWINVFTPKTWEEFNAAGGDVSGFPDRSRGTVSKISVGDVLVCYVAEISRWIGTLEVVGAHFVDDSRIWSGDRPYDHRLRVRPLLQLELETAVPAVMLKDEMPMFQALANPNKWSIFFRRSPTEMSEGDAAIVIGALEQASKDPIVRPIRRRKSTSPTTPSPVNGPETETTPTIDTTRLPDASDEVGADEPTGSDHTEIQWRLLRLGSEMGLEVWAPRADRGRQWNGHQPGDVKGLMEGLPAQFNSEAMKTIGNIDVLWLQGGTFVAAFEIENSTAVYSGLLRMADLLSLVPNLSIPLYIVAPDDRRPKVFREVNRPTFALREPPLRDVCQFIPYSAVRDGYEQVKQYAKFMKPTLIEQWAEVCEISVAE